MTLSAAALVNAVTLTDAHGRPFATTDNGDGTSTLDIDVNIEGVEVTLGTIKLLDSGGTNTAAVSSAGALKVEGGGTAGTAATGVVTVQGIASGVAQPVSAASLPLPSGAATSLAQTTAQTSLTSIDGKITAVNTGAVVVSSSALPSGAATLAKQPALGTAGTPSADVITVQGVTSMTPLKTDGSGVTQPVSGTVTANIGTVGTLATEATLGTVLTTSDFDSKAGSLTETAPATDTASSGLNGRLQRIAQRLTSLIALLPGSLGQKAMAASLAVTVASDQSAIPASQSGTWTVQPGNTANTTAWKVDGSAVTQPVSGTVTASNVTGSVASGATDSGNPVKIGGVGHTAAPTAVTDGQRVDFAADKYGRQLIVGSLAELNADQSTTITASTSETTIVTADASNKLNVHLLILSNSGTAATEVAIRDSTAGTIRANIYVPAGDSRGFAVFESAGVKQATANNNWTAQCSVATTSLKVFAKYTKIPS